MKNKKGSRRNRNKSAAHNNPQLVVDRFTKLPDDLLLNILDRLDTPDAVRTCLLSNRTLHLRHMLSRFQISVDSFVPNCGYATLKDTIPMNSAVADATDSILTFRRQDIPLRHLSVCFYLKYYDCLTIGKAVVRAMATNNLLDSVEFIILPEKKPEHYSTYDLRHNGKQFMRFFGACTDAFAGLTRLYLCNLRLGETDIPNIIATCKLLEYLCLSFCETEDSVLQLQVEHPRLAELDIYHAGLELVELNYLPNLKHLDFSLWVCPHEPLSFGNVPLLSSLSLTNVAMRYQEVIRLSHFLANVPNISDLYLNFGSEKKKSAAHNNPQLVVDRFTKLPDDLLLNILDRLNTPDAVRTCLLSKRTIHLRHMLSRFQISVDSFVPDCGYATLKDTIPMNAAVADATDSILNFRRQDIPLRHLSVCFYLKYYDCLTIGKAVARAMATNNLLDSVEFIILPEKKPEHYSTYDLRHNGKQLMRFFGACTDAFAGLTRLYLRNLKLGETDIPNIIATCKLLEYLRLSFCETEDSVLQLQVEHPRLVELDIYHASLELVELNYLPNLKHLDFSLWVCPHEPLSFGNVPLLSSLSLTNVAMRYQEVIRLSHFLANVPNISDLYLNFGSEKIWVQPECPKLLAPVLRNLQVLNLDELPEECDISWTCFFLEAAPSLKEMRVTVWDHWCGMQTDKVEREEQGYSEKANVEWESSAPDGFRHYNLTKLTIYGFQPNDNFLGYIRHIMEAAVNLEDVSLYDRKVLECCEDLDLKIKVAPSWYPQTIEEEELLRKQITEGLVMASPHVIHFRS
uniref:F-box domain-containing protein n=1 Tax=Oryza nivara TaxID=4536 RepID=A0A0E0GF52_ORYNI